MIAPLSLDGWRRFYREHIARDFPPDEVPPSLMLKQMLRSGLYDGLAYLDENGEQQGYAIVKRKDGAAFVFLYAVYPEVRGRGVGSAFMRELFDELRDCDYLVLEVERPELAASDDERTVREKRIRFYERLGYTVCRRVDYEVYHVPMWLCFRLLRRQDEPSPAELAAVMRGFYSHAKGLPLKTDLI